MEILHLIHQIVLKQISKMKNSVIIIISFLALTACNCLNKKTQTKNDQLIKKEEKIYYLPLSSFKQDTLEYIKQNFLQNKTQFTGEEFSFFLEYLEVPIKRFGSYIGYPPSSNYSFVSIQFYKYEERENLIKKKKNPMNLIIYFETPIPPERMDSIRKITNNNWTNDAAAFFSKQKIKNIQMVDYGF